MEDHLRIGIASFGVREFQTIHSVCRQEGHDPLVHVYSRSMRPGKPTDDYAAAAIGPLLGAIPAGVDLLVPAGSEGLARALAGYGLDLLVVYGFNWKLPPSVLATPRLGVINLHCSLLPAYRGPAPVLWAIRNGDRHLGVTVHRMDEDFDTGPVLAQQDGIPIPDDVTPDILWPRLEPVIRRLLAESIGRISNGVPGIPQDDARASRAGLMEAEFSVIDRTRTAREIHNQVRTFRFMGPGLGPTVDIGGRALRVLRTALTPADGIRLDCADGPLWITESAPG
ncbi:formyltransferase family protein [Kitasatospora sp. NPDC048722]|uniref:methionyl-tRNA formyltransferase n=1 Tax=Kitasatospora sp. NPDC048722 TaxID=3155639 RepID=UPI0033DC1DE6